MSKIVIYSKKNKRLTTKQAIKWHKQQAEKEAIRLIRKRLDKYYDKLSSEEEMQDALRLAPKTIAVVNMYF